MPDLFAIVKCLLVYRGRRGLAGERSWPREELSEKTRCGESKLDGARIGVGPESTDRSQLGETEREDGETKAILRCVHYFDEIHAQSL